MSDISCHTTCRHFPTFPDIPRHSLDILRHIRQPGLNLSLIVYCISGACVGLARSQQRRFEVNVETGFQTPGGGAQPGFGPFLTWFRRRNDPVLPSFLRGTGLSTEPGFMHGTGLSTRGTGFQREGYISFSGTAGPARLAKPGCPGRNPVPSSRKEGTRLRPR